MFGTGFHKGQLYSLADCLQMGRNFDRLSTPARVGAEPLLEPSGKIGHDAQQRLLESLGFPRMAGTITGLRVNPTTGLVTIDLDDIPTQFGQMVAARLYRDGSIEIAPPLPDPDDQSQELYPVITGVSFLGEEQPAVPVRFPIPKPTFADGTPVPPLIDLTPLAQAMAEVSRNFAGKSSETMGAKFNYLGKCYSSQVLCFSAMTPLPAQGKKTMTPEQEAALAAKGFTPEQIADIKATCGGAAMAVTPDVTPAPVPAPAPGGAAMTDPTAGGGDGDYMSMLKKFSDDAETPEPMKKFASVFSAFAASCAKRFAATEAALGDMQKDKPEMKAAAAFASQYRTRIEADHKNRVTSVVDEAILAGKVEARDRDVHVSHGEKQSDAQVFAAGTAHAGKTAYDVWREELLKRKPSRMFSQAIQEPTPNDNPENDPFVKAAMATLPGGRPLAYPLPAAA